jgi:small conductance mechanosensitive channel
MKFNLSEAAGAVQSIVNSFIERLPYFAVALVVFIIFLLVGTGVRAGVRVVTQRNRRHYNLGVVMGRLSYGLIFFVGLLIALVIAIPGFTPGELVNILGLSSVAIGFAFRDILQNFLAGILLLLTEPFRIGDQIILNDFEGTVEDIQTRATFIKTYDGRRVVIPNSNLFTNSVTVNTAYKKRRLEYEVSIGYGDDIGHAKRVLLDTVRKIPEVLSDPAPDALVVRLADSSVNIRLRWWVQPPRRFESLIAQDVVLEKIAAALLSEGFDLPFPTRQILFHDQTEASDGDRSRQREGWPLGKGEAPRPARIVDALRDLKQACAAKQGTKPP